MLGGGGRLTSRGDISPSHQTLKMVVFQVRHLQDSRCLPIFRLQTVDASEIPRPTTVWMYSEYM